MEIIIIIISFTSVSSPHPYIFFNPDGHTMTFLGFSIQQRTGDLMDQQTAKVLEKRIVSRELFEALKLNKVPLTEDFDALPRSLPLVLPLCPPSPSISVFLCLSLCLHVSLSLVYTEREKRDALNNETLGAHTCTHIRHSCSLPS